MSFFVILLLLLLGNWGICALFLSLPFNLIGRISSLSGLIYMASILLFLGWCLGDD
jgi:hypothetical protein